MVCGGRGSRSRDRGVVRERGRSWSVLESRGRRRQACGVAVLVVEVLLLFSFAVAADASKNPQSIGFAAHLATLDPGARADATTIVGTGNGQIIYGVPGRTNFIAALGSDETVFGGDRNDQLGGRGNHVTIVAGNGNDLIYGGPGGTLIGGTGRDVLVETKPDASIIVKGSKNEVAVTGSHDRVLCVPGIRDDVIYAGASDTVSNTCRADHARVLRAGALRHASAVLRSTASGAITGDGSNDHPFTASCDDPQHVDCTVSAFPSRTLTGSWQSEYVPAYECPVDHPYLLDHGYAPFGTSLPHGVEIREDATVWGIGISISGVLERSDQKFSFFSGTATGDSASSATNAIWDGTHWYQVVLHCTSDRCHGGDLVGPPPDCGGGAVDDRARQARVAPPTRRGLAAHLAGLDPGARVDGNTIVVTGDGTTVFAVPHRPNFIIGLGSNEKIYADGRASDEVGALGSDVTIRAGAGNDALYGGPAGTLIGGAGRDLLVDTKADATVLIRSRGDEVVVAGHKDKVLCSQGARRDLIYRGAGDPVGRTCGADHDRVRSDQRLHDPGLAKVAAAATITGDGTNANPFRADCDTFDKTGCTVTSFPERHLNGLWANDSVPSYRCPESDPWLYNQNYAPAGTTISRGVEIQEDWGTPWPIGISITATLSSGGLLGHPEATETGFPNSSATNWTVGDHWYKVILHCTHFDNLAAPPGGVGLG